MSFLLNQKNKLKYQTTLYSGKRKKKRIGRGLGSNPFEFSIAIFGPKCGKTHYVALKIPVSLRSSASKIEKYSAFSCTWSHY